MQIRTNFDIPDLEQEYETPKKKKVQNEPVGRRKFSQRLPEEKRKRNRSQKWSDHIAATHFA